MSSNQPKDSPAEDHIAKTGSVLTPPGEGERRAQRGYTHQYSAAAVAIYAGLDRGDLRWIGLADRSAGIADDVVLGYDTHVVGHQFKRSTDPGHFRIRTLLCGASGLLPGLIQAWRQLRSSCSGQTIEIRIVVTDTPSENDSLNDDKGTTAEFINDWQQNPTRLLVDWRGTVWRNFIEELLAGSGLTESEFEEFFRHLELIHGKQPSFSELYGINNKAEPLIEHIARVLPTLVAKLPGKDRWTKAEFLRELDWPGLAQRHDHRFPLGGAVQHNPATEARLRQTLDAVNCGYLSLVGPPGTGKSTLLQVALESEPKIVVVRYLAFVPGAAQGVGRAEADDFLADLIAALREGGLQGVRYRCTSTFERREEFEALLRAAGDRFARHGVKTLIAIDGLDHVSREERPERSFLKELPLPGAMPNGVLLLLGTQRVDLPDIPPAVIAQASDASRRTAMTPLPLAAIAAMADGLGLPAEIARPRLYELGKGHPLATHYLVEALLAADDAGKESLLQDGFDYSGDIEDVYRSAWRWIEADSDALEVMGLIARAEAPVGLQQLAQIVPDASVQRAWDKTRHLLARDASGWFIFHNSFRLFILRQLHIRLGDPDPDYSRLLYRKLVELARRAPARSPQNDLELRYLMRASDHSDALRIAKPAHFRAQFIAGRSSRDIQDDIRLAFQSLKTITDPTSAFALVLSADEIQRRASTLDDSSDIVEALICLRDLDAAECFVEDIGGNAYPVVRAWLAAGDFERARALFERIEPLHDLATHADQLDRDDSLVRWAQHAIHFRQPAEICAGIHKIVETARRGERSGWDFDPDVLSHSLRLRAALATVHADPERKPVQVLAEFSLSSDDECLLTVTAALALISNGAVDAGLAILIRLVADPEPLQRLSPRVRRHASLASARLGKLETARVFITGATVPSIAMLDDEINYDAPRPVIKAVIEYAELSTLLGDVRTDIAPSKKTVLVPLQQFTERAGQLAARSLSVPTSIPAGEIGRESLAFLTYVTRATPRSSGEYFAITQLGLAVPTVIQSLLQSASRIGPVEFRNTVQQIDRAITAENAGKLRFRALLISVAESVARHQSDYAEAEHRLDDLIDIHGENTPAEYINDRAKLISAYARIGKSGRGFELLAQLRNETLGYALRAKKDPQYAFWRTLMEEANRVDPTRRRERVEILARQTIGMAETEGRDAAYRLAHTLVVEAATESAGFGWAIGNHLLEADLIEIPSLVDATMLGSVRRRSDQVALWVEVWVNLCLPFYREAYYRESHEGDFIREAIAACSSTNLATIANRLAHCIGISAQLDVRRGLVGVLATALATRGFSSTLVDETVARISKEYQLPKRGRGTPERYEDVTSMEELVQALARDSEAEPKPAGYEMARAFSRLLPTSTVDRAVEILDSNPAIRSDSRARFDLVDVAITQGRMTEAMRLTDDFSLASRDDATWAWFMGGARLRLFRAMVRLKGDEARVEAYADFVTQLAARAESLTALLPEIDDLWPVITKEPAWAEMWQYLQEQLATTRDHRMGRALRTVEEIDDQALVARLIEVVIVLPVTETQWHAGNCALRLATDAPESFCSLIRRLMTGSEKAEPIALRLLFAAHLQTLPEDLRDAVMALSDDDDLAIRQYATEIAQQWGGITQRHDEPLPPFYRVILPSAPPPHKNEQLRHSEFGPPVASDPELWSGPFARVIELLGRHDISEDHIRMRMTQLIDSWGGVQAYGREAGQRLTTTLNRFGLRLPHFYPHILAGAQALRHVAGEFERAGVLIDGDEIDFVLDLLTPFLATAGMNIGVRPKFVLQPTPPETFLRDAEIQQWLAGVEQDVNPPVVDSASDKVIAEVTRYEFKSFSTTYAWSRARIPMVRLADGVSPFEAYHSLPTAIHLRGAIQTTSYGRALVRRVSRSLLPQRPEFELALDAQLVRNLGWSPINPEQSEWIGAGGNAVASVRSWRDAGPDGDVHSECLWGEGAMLTVTPDGLRELEAAVGPIFISVSAEREIHKEGKQAGQRIAISSEVLSCS